MGILRSFRPLPITKSVPFAWSTSASCNLTISASRPGVSQKAYRIARSRDKRKRRASVLAKERPARVKVPHLIFGDYGERLLIQLGRAEGEHGLNVVGPALPQPVEEPVQAAVIALGELSDLIVGPFPEPPHPVLEVREILLQVLGGDLLYARPALLLGVEDGHVNSGFEAGEVSRGVPVGGLHAAEEPFAVCAKTVVKNLLDDRSSGGT